MTKNYAIASLEDAARDTLHDKLGLTGAEISMNHLAARTEVPFLHSHKENEEVYIILEGKGQVTIDDEIMDIAKGQVIRIAPQGIRKFSAAKDEGVRFLCVQAKENSLQQYTEGDGVIV